MFDRELESWHQNGAERERMPPTINVAGMDRRLLRPSFEGESRKSTFTVYHGKGHCCPLTFMLSYKSLKLA